MGRHKETYTAKWNPNPQTTISSQGEIIITLTIQSGDRGRPVELRGTEDNLRLMMKSVEEARLRHATDQLRRELGPRVSELQRQVWDRDLRIEQLDRQRKELEGRIERVRDAVQVDQADAPDRSKPFGFFERPDVAVPPSNVAH